MITMSKTFRDKLREMGGERVEGSGNGPPGTEQWKVPEQTRDQLKRMREINEQAERQRIKNENTVTYVEGSPGRPPE